MASRRQLGIVVASVAMLGIVPVFGAAKASAPTDWAANLPGCHADNPAVGHHANQQVLADQSNGPVPCGMRTGWPTVETRVEVTNDNAVIQEPALLTVCPVAGGSGHIYGCGGRGEGLARTFNDGGKWDTVSVQVPPDLIVEEGGVDNNLYVDHDTGRLFFYLFGPHYVEMPGCLVPGVNPATIAFSDDNGTTWNWGFDLDHACSENPTVVTAKPTPSGGQPSGYHNVVYLCGDDTSTGVGGTGNPGFSCSKSLTGGSRWLGSIIQGTVLSGQGFYSGPAKDHLHPYAQCAGQSSSAGAGVQPLPHGTLAVVVTCGANSYLSESTDEGATWNIPAGQKPIGHGGSLRIDSAGNMYLLEKSSDSTKLLLSRSTDGGSTWSSELNMVAPGVTSVGTYNFAQGTFAQGLVGDVAVTYYGNRKGNTTSDGFITATRDALDNNPVFWSGQVNSVSRPLLYNTQTDGNIGITILDFNGGAWSQDGQSVWGSWVQDCGTNVATDPNCQSRYPGTNPADPEDGFAGRLVWPPRAA
jgi:hypothetical protein